MADPRHSLGRTAERVAAHWLEACGWRVLETRWRCAQGELDIICSDARGWLVGVEVRARRSDRAGSALESMDRRHMARLRAALGVYARRSDDAYRGLRVDLVSVMPAPGVVPAAWRLRRVPQVDAW